MEKFLLSRRALVAPVVVLVPFAATAAPLPRDPPVNVCGTIIERSWVPAEFRRGKPGFSGSLGHDRVFPAYLRVVMEHYSGVDPRAARRINGFQGFADGKELDANGLPKRLLLQLPSDDPNLLAAATDLCVEGFRITGDEGGTWTHYDRIVASPRSR